MEYQQFLKQNPKITQLDPNLPEDIQISTMTMICKVPFFFNVVNIAKYIPLSKDFILSVRCGNSNEISRSLIPIKEKKKLKTPAKKNFFNQATMVVKTVNTQHLNIKLFRNGALQLTGCKNISIPTWTLHKLFEILKKPIIVDEKEILFVSSNIFVDIQSIHDFKIAMINSNFHIGFQINREKLFELLIKDKYDCVYDPSRHAGVNLRYMTKTSIDTTKPVSIFIFDKGSIIITGARNYRQVLECYKFINLYLLDNYPNIVQQNS